ncbi:MAG: flagellar filament capping protein FliD [Caldicoprobacterales bacterium]|jgi:flagellar hook-associated protein 2
MSINSMYSLNRMRFGGLASGLDTDTIVKDLMKIEQMKVDKLKQEKQIIEWRKEDYRSTTNLLRGFYDEYFDILYSKTNMTSQSTYNTLKVQSSDDKYITATASPNAYVSDRVITRIELAKAAQVKGASVSAPLRSGELNETLNLTGHTITVTVDGTTKLIEFNGEYGSENGYQALIDDLQSKLNEAFGHNRIEVSFDSLDNRIILDAGSSIVTVWEHPTGEGMDNLGFRPNQSNRINLDSTLLGLSEFGMTGTPLVFDSEGMVNFTINGVDFSFSENDTLRTVINRINSSKAGVTIAYSSLTDSFQLTNKNTGAAHTLTYMDGLEGSYESGEPKGGNLLEALGFAPLDLDDPNSIPKGQDAVMVMDGITIYRSTNNFTIDGVTYNLTHEFEAVGGQEPITLTMSTDVDQAFENIKSFIDAYNKVIDTLNKSLSAERFRDYPPLTDDQREAMSEKEIELWEEKARSGLLQRDPILQRIVYDMRRALVDSVEGVDINLSSIGITTGSYTEGGRLHLDEGKLKEALREKGDEVMRLFSNKSDIAYSPDNDSDQRQIRYRESGLVHRLSDILQDNIRTRRDKNGRKGTLIEKAGIVGDASERVNLVDDQLKDMNKRIDAALERMYRVENRYWEQFTALETALQRMSSQSMWLMQQFGGGMY